MWRSSSKTGRVIFFNSSDDDDEDDDDDDDDIKLILQLSKL